MIRAISSPSSSTTGWATLIFAIKFILVCGRTKVLPSFTGAEDRGRKIPGQARDVEGSYAALEEPGGGVVPGWRLCFECGHQGRDCRDHPEQLSCLRPRKAFYDDIV